MWLPGSSVHRWCGALALHMHHPCIALCPSTGHSHPCLPSGCRCGGPRGLAPPNTESNDHCCGVLTTVPMLHLGPLFSSLCSVLIFFLLFLLSAFFFSSLVPLPPLLPPPFSPLSSASCLLAWSLALLLGGPIWGLSLVAQVASCTGPRHFPSQHHPLALQHVLFLEAHAPHAT